jgi:hypothetical protein
MPFKTQAPSMLNALNAIHYERGTVAALPASASHLYDRYLVTCAKHNQTVEVTVNNFWEEGDLYNELLKAFDQCAGCIDEKLWGLTRFPEGAEI